MAEIVEWKDMTDQQLNGSLDYVSSYFFLSRISQLGGRVVKWAAAPTGFIVGLETTPSSDIKTGFVGLAAGALVGAMGSLIERNGKKHAQRADEAIAAITEEQDWREELTGYTV